MIIVSPVFEYQIVASVQRETKKQCHHNAKNKYTKVILYTARQTLLTKDNVSY
jgi:hypothetical protein